MAEELFLGIGRPDVLMGNWQNATSDCNIGLGLLLR
jgi:hypothetical protein